ncbi:MAG: hypothetical protein KF858_02450 [Candidatus Sumerlaeia bacterium]|nr:hypothetical protein [Candidatus Sumerlaeia bacterium]
MKIRVTCSLNDCFYHHAVTGLDDEIHACDCSHPDKPMHLRQVPCPIYKKNWSKLNAPDVSKFRQLRRRVG